MIMSRKALLGLGGALVALVGIVGIGVSRVPATAHAQTVTSCNGNFEAREISGNPDSYVTAGRLFMEIDNVNVKGFLETANGDRFNLEGNTNGRGINFVVDTPGALIFGSGSSSKDFSSCKGGVMGGSATILMKAGIQAQRDARMVPAGGFLPTGAERIGGWLLTVDDE